MLSIFMSCLINVKCDYDDFVIIFTLDVWWWMVKHAWWKVCLVWISFRDGKPEFGVNYFGILEWVLGKMQSMKVVDIYVYYIPVKCRDF